MTQTIAEAKVMVHFPRIMVMPGQRSKVAMCVQAAVQLQKFTATIDRLCVTASQMSAFALERYARHLDDLRSRKKSLQDEFAAYIADPIAADELAPPDGDDDTAPPLSERLSRIAYEVAALERRGARFEDYWVDMPDVVVHRASDAPLSIMACDIGAKRDADAVREAQFPMRMEAFAMYVEGVFQDATVRHPEWWSSVVLRPGFLWSIELRNDGEFPLVAHMGATGRSA